MKKIIMSLAMIGAVSALVIGATGAFFSDTETSTGNTFTAGTIDIAIDGKNPWTTNYTTGDLKPCETGYMNFNIQNVGENPVDVSKRLFNFVESDGIKSESECSEGNGTWNSENNTCTGDYVPVNNIQSQIIYDLYVEVFASTGATEPIWWQAIYENEDEQSLDMVYGTTGGNYVALGMIPAGGYMKVTQSYHFDCDAGNVYQGDILTFDMEIKGEQLTGEGGYAASIMENKEKGADGIWDIVQGDNVEGVLQYKTQGDKFDFKFSGTPKINGDYTLLYVGSTNNYPCTGSVVLGTANYSGTPISIIGQVETGSISGGKVWLIPSSSYSGTLMTGWPEANILFETSLIDYLEI